MHKTNLIASLSISVYKILFVHYHSEVIENFLQIANFAPDLDNKGHNPEWKLVTCLNNGSPKGLYAEYIL